jgi:predicted dehydrogenase
MRIAVVGASGIGRHHAKWFALEGCEVAAFVGRTPETVQATDKILRDLFSFSGRGYTDVAEMLAREKPDAVSVCSPHHLHNAHAVAALGVGAHVLCEKPIFWDTSMSAEQMLSHAKDMMDEAARAGRLLAVNTQYLAAIGPYDEIYRQNWGEPRPIESVFLQMESKGGRSGANEFDEIWIDLASHPLSLVLRWLPGAEIARGSIDCTIERHRVVAKFLVRNPEHESVPVEILLQNVFEGSPVRRMGLNGHMVDIGAGADASGTYRTFLRWDSHQRQCDDLVHTSIKRFIAAVSGQGEPLATASEAYHNLRLHLQILHHAKRL